MSDFGPLPPYEVRVVRLDPTLAELHIVFADLPAEVEVRGRLTGPRCPGVSTVEVAYPLHALGGGKFRALIPEPLLHSEQQPFVYDLRLELRRGENSLSHTSAVGLQTRSA